MSISWRIKTYDRVPSTQDILREALINGESEGLVIYANSQSKGRGRHGNKWISEQGNLYTSILLQPNCSADDAGHYSFIVALALSASIKPFIPDAISRTLKWPNDLLLSNKKCAGILLESELSHKGQVESLLIGVGLNISHPPKDRACLEEYSKKPIEKGALLDTLLKHINNYIKAYKKHGFSKIRQEWLLQAAYLDQNIQARLVDRTLTGQFIDLDQNGALIMKDKNQNIHKITAGEIHNL